MDKKLEKYTQKYNQIIDNQIVKIVINLQRSYPANRGIELLRGIRKYFDFYTNQRRHNSLNQITPNNFYYCNFSVS